MKRRHISFFRWYLILLLGLYGCGPKSGSKGPQGQGAGKVEQAFSKAARENGIPVRYLMAVGYLESHLAPAAATATYPSTSAPETSVERGTIMTQTAFGLSAPTLGLDLSQASTQELETQIHAYAKYVGDQLKAANVKLPADPKTPEERFYWLENLALLQRKGVAQRRNVQIVFANELMQILNKGFVWQDPRDGAMIRLEPENPPLDRNAFPPNAKNWLQLTEFDAQLYIATYLPLVTVPSGEIRNKAKRVEVIQCPMSLSACLELQTRGEDSDIRLAGHYIIPADKTIFNKALQVADHNEALVLSNGSGDHETVQDAIVIMLTGDSGRMSQGKRYPALPTWVSDPQLRTLGQLINDTCTLLSQKDPDVKREECMDLGGARGVHFRSQGNRDDYKWGDIPDFDPSIFSAYIRSPSGLGAEITFEMDANKKFYRAGENLPLNVLLDPQARTVELERLARCQSGKVVWEPVQTKQIRGERRLSLQTSYFDAGPNQNGEQFFRVRVYGKDTRLIGWSVSHTFIRGYEEGLTSASEKFCKSPML